jgi:hypothetical protein
MVWEALWYLVTRRATSCGTGESSNCRPWMAYIVVAVVAAGVEPAAARGSGDFCSGSAR